jgi:ligand-binding sensor domain-containing protein/signal transduction histidine kinase
MRECIWYLRRVEKESQGRSQERFLPRAHCVGSTPGSTIRGVADGSARRLGWSLVLWCALGPHALRAAIPLTEGVRAENYTTRVWQTQDGLPQQTVQAVAQTQDGFLWIGTTGGLLRFDGSRFVTFERGNTPAFQENSVFSLMTARDGTLWIGTEGGGLIRMKDGQFRSFGAADGLQDGFVRATLEDARGAIWIGTDNGLFRLANGSAERATRSDATSEIPALAVHALAQTKDGTIWVGGSRLVALRDGTATDYPLVGQYSETRVKSILQTRNGTVWVGTVSGLQRLTPGATRFERFAGIQGTVRTLRETRDGTLWIGTIGQGAYTWRGGLLTALESGVGKGDAGLKLPSKTVLSLFEDGERNVWVGTQAGVVRFSRSLVELVPLPNASDSDFETISRDRDGTLWVASTRLSHLIDGVAIPTTFASLHGARVRNVFRAQDGALWVGTDGRGLFRLGPGGTTATQYTTANGLVNNFVRGMIGGRNGDLWVATDEGVSRLAHGVFHNYTVAEGLAYFSVRAMLVDRAGDLWIGTDRGLSHLVGDRFLQDAATRALSGEKVWALDQSASGSLWIGTRDNGLYRYLPGAASAKHFTTEQGLASNSVYAILQDRKGRFWISGANGVDVISIADLEKMAANSNDPPAYLSQRFFAVSEGGELTPLYGGTMPAGTMAADGDAWFPTSKGPVHFLAGETDSSAVPKVFLDSVVADGRPLTMGDQPVELAADNRNLEISYGSILLGPQDAVQFQYKLDGFDREWRYGSNRRVADYTNLPASTYTFRVRAFQGGSGRLTERDLGIVKRQYFYLTWWFLSLCLGAVALAVWLVHLQRVRRVKIAFEAVLEERARLAREMHDTLIQGCTGVSLLLEACSSADAGQGELLDYARTQLAASIDEARQAVWNLRGQESADFGEALTMLAERLGRSSPVEFRCEVKGEAYKFHSGAMHEITMASREAIYNALLHANPTRIDVFARFSEEEFALSVEDNGSGFDSSSESLSHAPEGHFGLVGIEERVRRLGGTVRVKSVVAKGTNVSIRVPRSSVCFEAKQRTETQTETEVQELMR